MIFLGIDPGKNGGISMIDTATNGVCTVPFSEENMISLYRVKERVALCILEKVNAMPGQGVVSMFNFGMNFGFIQGCLKAYGIPFELVPPQKWKKEFSVTSDKNTSIDVAMRLFPDVDLRASERCKKLHDGMAEALLMAEYGRRHYNV